MPRFLGFENAVRLSVLTHSPCSPRQEPFQLIPITATTFAMILHDTARVALFDTMTKCIVAFQPIGGGLDRLVGAHDRAISTMKKRRNRNVFIYKSCDWRR